MSRFSSDLHGLLDRAELELCVRTARSRSSRAGDLPHWRLHPERGLLTFTKDDGSGLVGLAQIAGTYRRDDSSWLWSWANPSLHEPLTVAARDACAVLRVKGFTEAAEPRLHDVTEEIAWQLTALTGLTRGAMGTYRAPAGQALVFIAHGPLAELVVS